MYKKVIFELKGSGEYIHTRSRRIVSSRTGPVVGRRRAEEPIQKTQQYRTAKQRLLKKGSTMVIPLV